MLQTFWAAWLNHFKMSCRQWMFSELCGGTEHVHPFGRTGQNLNIYFWRKNRISILEIWTLSIPYLTLWNLLSDEKDYRLMFSILSHLRLWNYMSFALCGDCCGNFLLSLIFYLSHIILLPSWPKTAFVLEPLSSCSLCFPIPRIYLKLTS